MVRKLKQCTTAKRHVNTERFPLSRRTQTVFTPSEVKLFRGAKLGECGLLPNREGGSLRIKSLFRELKMQKLETVIFMLCEN